MLKKVPNIQRINNNDILKIVNIVFFMGEVAPCHPLLFAVYSPGSHHLQIPLPHLIRLRI
jgi:hypothetical protein